MGLFLDTAVSRSGVGNCADFHTVIQQLGASLRLMIYVWIKIQKALESFTH